jgi:hypothetical protein
MPSPPSEMPMTPERNIRRFVGFAAGGFVITCVIFFFIAGAISPEVEPGYDLAITAVPSSDGTFRVTIDVKNRDHWVGVNLAEGTMVTNHGHADFLARRYILRAPGGAVDMGSQDLATAKVGPGAVWIGDASMDGEPQNDALTGWYEYSYWTHLLSRLDKTFAVRLAGGGIAYLQVLSYYCEPEGSGCLTIKYRIDHGSG